MNRKVGSVVFLLVICFLLIVTNGCDDESEPKSTTCKPSGKLSGKNPPGGCHTDDCCKAGKFYDIYKCSPPVTHHTKATLTENDFSEGGSGGAQAECDNKYHSNSELIVALSTGWYNKGKRCHKFIKIHGNGKTVKAKVVDECDSTVGCDKDHDYEPPCDNNIVDASAAVWNALGVPKNSDKRGWMDIYWSDA